LGSTDKFWGVNVRVNRKLIVVLLPLLAWIGCAEAALKKPVPMPNTPEAQSMNQLIENNMYKELDYFANKLDEEGESTRIDGVKVFKSDDKFIPGKVAISLGELVLHAKNGSLEQKKYLRIFKNLADQTVVYDNHTWGIYYYMSILYKLKKAGLIDKALRPATYLKLKEQLDWRSFVALPSYQLINLPTNYYGVAFSIARLRFLMGWEDDSSSQKLLQIMLDHYQQFSGEYGFSDETDGQGRFDRYSILLVAEIAERLVETGLPVPDNLKAILRKSADVALMFVNGKGDGFSFGRSLGPYSETALIEILSISSYLNVLTPEEKKYAYAFSTSLTKHYFEFWQNPETKSLDLWGQGRRTDKYRGKHRILGENFSLGHQFIMTNETWNNAGFANQSPAIDLDNWVERTQPANKLVWFAKGDFDRALFLHRDKGHLFSLLMVNGGKSQHDNSPYYPLPYSNNLVSGVADSGPSHAQLLPKITLSDNSVLLPTAFIRDIKVSDFDKNPKVVTVSFEQDMLDKMGQAAPVADARLSVKTTYTFTSGSIKREDVFSSNLPTEIDSLVIEFGAFSKSFTQNGLTTTFKSGLVNGFTVSGLDACITHETLNDPDYQAPYGAMSSVVACTKDDFLIKDSFPVSWTLNYQ
jgi:hypothetical protein